MEDIIKINVQRLLQDVYEMRMAQKAYFQMPGNTYRMKVAKAKEGNVDDWIKQGLKSGAIKPEVEVITNKLF